MALRHRLQDLQCRQPERADSYSFFRDSASSCLSLAFFSPSAIMELLKIVAPAIIPIPFSFYFDIFDGFLQAYVFVFLTALFMNEEQE